MATLKLSESEHCMSIKQANDIRDLKEQVKVLEAEMHQVKKLLKIPVNPKTNGSRKAK